MGRIVAIDYGTKRVGVAVSDPSKIIANPLGTWHSKDIIEFLKKYCQTEQVDCFVIGLPRQMDGSPSESEKNIIHFINTLKKNFPPIKIERYDERFTSKMAMQTMIDAGLRKTKRRDKGLVDKIAATIILQDYMESLKIGNR